jgi:hypothetical protein
MVRFLFLALFFISGTVYAETSLRVGSKVLTIGDSVVKLQQLMGEPAVRTFLSSENGGLPSNQLAPREQWQYAQDGKTIVVTVVGGRIAKFETLYD